jgi:hypothetical protein
LKEYSPDLKLSWIYKKRDLYLERRKRFFISNPFLVGLVRSDPERIYKVNENYCFDF